MTTSMVLILIVIGIITGVMAGMLGIGGAIIMVPALVYIMGLGQQAAQGTSLAVMLPPIGIIAAWNYYKAGQVNLKFAVILAVFFIVGSYFGSKISLALPASVLKKIFGLLLLAVAAKMLLSK
jgi:uncharacterized membrane protein YfcA